MKFETNPQLILTKKEFETLDNALKLCRDMDNMTSETDGCEKCPITDCAGMYTGCIFIRTHKLLKQIIDIAVVR